MNTSSALERKSHFSKEKCVDYVLATTIALCLAFFAFLLWVKFSASANPWGSALYWKSDVYATNTYYVAYLVGMVLVTMVVVCFFMAMFLANRNALIIALVVLAAAIYALASDGKKDFARFIGYTSGWAQQTCWVPDSQECRDVTAFKGNPAAHKRPDSFF